MKEYTVERGNGCILYSCWIGLKDYKVVIKRKIKHMDWKKGLRLLLKHYGKFEVRKMLGVKGRTLRSYYWGVRKERKGKWGRAPSQKVQAKINKMASELQEKEGKKIVVDSSGYVFDVNDTEIIEQGYNAIMGEVKEQMGMAISRAISRNKRAFVQIIYDGYMVRDGIQEEFIFSIKQRNCNEINIKGGLYNNLVADCKEEFKDKMVSFFVRGSGLEFVIKRVFFKFYLPKEA